MTNLLRMCSESGCEKIMVDGKWIDREYLNYQQEIDSAEHISDAYCPEHLNNNSFKRQLTERRKSKIGFE